MSRLYKVYRAITEHFREYFNGRFMISIVYKHDIVYLGEVSIRTRAVIQHCAKNVYSCFLIGVVD